MRAVLLLAVLSGFATGSGQAQTCLEMADALRLAATQDPRVAAARARIDLAEAEFQEALALRRPSISAFARSSAGDTGLTSNQIENQVGVRVSQRLLDFGDARLARRAARDTVRSQEHALQSDQITAAADAGLAVLAHGQIGESQALIEERIAYFQDLSDRLETLLQSGAATRDAVAAVRARLAAARAELAQNELIRIRASIDLATLTGAMTEPCGGIDETTVLALSRFDVEMEATSPELRQLRSQIRAAEADAERERRARLPAIDLVAIGSYAYDDIRDEWAPRDRVGVDVSIPLYEGDRLRARSQRASAALALTESELTAAERRLRFELQASTGQIRALRDLRDRREAAAERKAEELAAIELAFEGGQRTLFELLETRVALSEARAELIAVRYELYAEYLRLGELTGALDIPVDPVDGPQTQRIWGWEPDPDN